MHVVVVVITIVMIIIIIMMVIDLTRWSIRSWTVDWYSFFHQTRADHFLFFLLFSSQSIHSERGRGGWDDISWSGPRRHSLPWILDYMEWKRTRYDATNLIVFQGL